MDAFHIFKFSKMQTMKIFLLDLIPYQRCIHCKHGTFVQEYLLTNGLMEKEIRRGSRQFCVGGPKI